MAADPKILDEMRSLTEGELLDVARILTRGNKAELVKMRDDANTTVLKAWFASSALSAIESGDVGALDKLLDRLLGKARSSLDVTQKPLQEKMTPEQRDARIKELQDLDRLLGTD